MRLKVKDTRVKSEPEPEPEVEFWLSEMVNGKIAVWCENKGRKSCLMEFFNKKGQLVGHRVAGVENSIICTNDRDQIYLAMYPK